LRRLIARTDVFLHNLAPGALARLGFGSGELRAAQPRLVTCEISGSGSSGPYREKQAYDLLVQSEAGLVSVTGTAETPSKVGISIADIAAGIVSAWGGSRVCATGGPAYPNSSSDPPTPILPA
jgi:crotonobetainyl-CoA:carnitine CoA-transferase CaiB-like acyl-CoA transferase